MKPSINSRQHAPWQIPYGRAAEIDMFRHRLNCLHQAPARGILLTGKATVGKTFLLKHWEEVARGVGCMGTFVTCLPEDRCRPRASIYAALVAVYSGLLDEPSSALRDECKRHAALMHCQLSVLATTPPSLPAEQDIQLLWRCLLAGFATQERTLAIFVDDLHYADAASLNMLPTLQAAAPSGSALICGAYTTDHTDSNSSLMNLSVGFTSLNLLALDMRHFGQLVETCAALHVAGADAAQTLENTQQRLKLLEQRVDAARTSGAFAHEIRNVFSSIGYALDTILPDANATSLPVLTLTPILDQFEQILRADDLQAHAIEVLAKLRSFQARLLETLDSAAAGVHRGLNLSRQMVAYIKSGHVETADDSVRVAQLVQSICQEFNGDFVKKRITLQLDVPASIVLSVKEDHVYSILRNLVANARDAVASAPEPRRICVRADVTAGQVRLLVEDSGVGISAGTAQRMFQPFFTTKGEGGTGLGLGLSRRLAEMYGGTIEFESSEGTGTLFTVMLPGFRVNTHDI